MQAHCTWSLFLSDLSAHVVGIIHWWESLCYSEVLYLLILDFVTSGFTYLIIVAQMEGSLAEELYSESLKLSKIDLGSSSTAISKEGDAHGIDVSLISLFWSKLSENS